MTTGVGAVETSGPAALPSRVTRDPDGKDTPDISPAATRTRRLVRLAAIAIAYYLGARLGLSLSLVGNDVTPFWPPTGVAVAALIVFGRSYWPAVAVAALAVNLPISANPLAAAVTAVGNTLAPVVAVTLLQRVGFRRQLDRQRDALAIVFLGALASMLVSATIGAATLLASGSITTARLPAPRGPCGGRVTPWASSPSRPSCCACLSSGSSARWPLAAVARGRHDPRRRDASSWPPPSTTRLHIFFLTLPLLGWAAWRLQLRSRPCCAHRHPPRHGGRRPAAGPFEGKTLLEQMVTLQAFNACVALTSFFLAALVSERMQTAAALEKAASELERRVEQRTAQLSAANARLVQEIQERSEAQELLSHEEARAQREHQIAETLQRSLLPDRLPDVPGVAARRALRARDGRRAGRRRLVRRRPAPRRPLGLAIGDVAGHGLAAAATMVQVRMALRAYALQDPVAPLGHARRPPARRPAPVPEMVTLLYLVFDPATRRLRWTNAGHPPALVVSEAVGHLPLGRPLPSARRHRRRLVHRGHPGPAPGATLLLYTDGLVERRGVSLTDGLDRLDREASAVPDDDIEALCERLLDTFLDEEHIEDDVAILAMRPLPSVDGELDVRLPAEARNLVQVRSALRRWLKEASVSEADVNEVLVACGEACANVVQHAYSGQGSAGELVVEARLDGGALEVRIRDHGHWRPAADRGGGWGLQLMDALMDDVDVEHTPGGTDVRLRRRVHVTVEA